MALSVEFPWKSLSLIPGDHTMIIRAVRKLRKENYVIVYNSGKQKSIKLAKKALSILDSVEPGLYDFYMILSENHSFRGVPAGDKSRACQLLARKHRVAESICMMKLINCAILPTEKPQLLFNNNATEPIPVRPLFYSSREIKNIDVAQKHKTEFSRIIGLLICEGGQYNIYNIGSGRIKWSSHGENKAQLLTSRVLNANFLYDGVNGFYKSESAIMFVNDFSAMNTILTARKTPKDEHGFELLSFDNTYDNIYMIPLSYNGAIVLKILSTQNWRIRLATAIFGDLPNGSVSGTDGVIKLNDKSILLMFDGNISNIKRFNQSLHITEARPDKWEILCFPWQAEPIRQYLDHDVTIKVLPEETVISSFFALDNLD